MTAPSLLPVPVLHAWECSVGRGPAWPPHTTACPRPAVVLAVVHACGPAAPHGDLLLCGPHLREALAGPWPVLCERCGCILWSASAWCTGIRSLP